MTTMSLAAFDKPFHEISMALSRSTKTLTLIQALNRTVLDFGKLSELLRHTELVKEMEEADAKCFRVGGPLDLESNWNIAID